MKTELQPTFLKTHLRPDSPGMNPTNWKRHLKRLRSYTLSPIREQLGAFERYLILTGKKETSRKYSKCIERFLAQNNDKKNPGDFYRPHVEQFKHDRLKAGIKPSTV